mmetsp:Transcript_6055/g.11865  ORF Transcript_6055/g.11865 Transcript_6055/m.11865 type:complete len:201 (-) Transcript_6055:1794-2396(-)
MVPPSGAMTDSSSLTLGHTSLRQASTGADLDESVTNLYPAPNLFFRRSEVPRTRSFPRAMIPTISPRTSASSMECVTRTSTRPLFAVSIISHTCLLETGSIPVVGSSRKTIFGSPVRDIATESLRCIPPESCPANLSFTSNSSTCSSLRDISEALSRFGTPLRAAKISICSPADNVSHRISCWGQTPRMDLTESDSLFTE